MLFTGLILLLFLHTWRSTLRLLARVLTDRMLRLGADAGGGGVSWWRRGIGMRWAVIAVGSGSFVVGVGLLGTGRIGFDIFPTGTRARLTSPW